MNMSDDQETIRQLRALVKQRDAELAAARQAAESASRAKSAFIGNLSHEIRTPMNAIVGLTWMLHEQATDPELKAKLQQVSNATQQLLAVINDLLDISRIESEQLVLEPLDFDLRQVINHLVANHGGKAAQKGLSFPVDLPPRLPALLRGDPVRIGQILGNFVSNAIKFTARGSVRLSIDLLPGEQDDAVVLHAQVADSGIGIPAEQCAGLFQPFQQIEHSTKRRFGGTGLGLAISKRLADMMGGQIGVHSQPDQGSVFWVKIPLTVVVPAVGVMQPSTAEVPGGEAPPIDWKRIGEILHSLESLLAEDDIQALALWHDTAPLLRPALGETSTRLEGELSRYSFDVALDIVRAFQARLPAG